MKVSPRPLPADSSHIRTTPSLSKVHVVGKLLSPHNDGKISGRKQFLKRQQFTTPNQNSTKTTFFLQDKKTNASSVNVHSETTLNSQLFRESPYKEWESRNTGKHTDRVLNSKETTTIVAGQSKRSSNPVELQLYDLKAVYDIKEKEIKDLEETLGSFRKKISKAEEFMDKNKHLSKTLRERENTIERLKISLQSVNHEIEELKLNKHNRSIQNIISEHYLTPRPNRKSKRVVLRTKSKSPSSTFRHIPAEIRFKMYKDEPTKKSRNSQTQRMQTPPSPKTKNLKAILNTAKTDSENYLFSAYFMNQIKDKNLVISNEHRTGSISHRNYGEQQSKSKKWLHSNLEYSPSSSRRLNSENPEKFRTAVKGFRPSDPCIMNGSPIFTDEKPDSPIITMFNTLLWKFSGVLENYKTSEKKLLKENKSLAKQLEILKNINK